MILDSRRLAYLKVVREKEYRSEAILMVSCICSEETLVDKKAPETTDFLITTTAGNFQRLVVVQQLLANISIMLKGEKLLCRKSKVDNASGRCLFQNEKAEKCFCFDRIEMEWTCIATSILSSLNLSKKNPL